MRVARVVFPGLNLSQANTRSAWVHGQARTSTVRSDRVCSGVRYRLTAFVAGPVPAVLQSKQDTDVMRQVLSIALTMTIVCLTRGSTGACAAAGAPQVLEQARVLLAGHEYQKAATILEDALPGSSASDRGAMVVLLRQSYRNLINQAEAAGKSREAAEYRETLAILEEASGSQTENTPRAVPAAPAAAASDAPKSPGVAARAESTPGRLPRAAEIPDRGLFAEPSPLPEPGSTPALEGPERAVPAPAAVAEPKTREKIPAPKVAPEVSSPHAQAAASAEPSVGPALVSGRPAAEETLLNQADRLFTDRKYEEAGRIYAILAGQNQLPAQRSQVWAYCRWVAVVARINAPPRSDREWDEIEQEIRSVQRLTPGNWYGEYLQNRVAEARRGGRAGSRSGRLVVRGSAPDENPPPGDAPRFLSRPRSAAAASQAAAEPANSEQPLGLPSPSSSREAQPEPVAAPSAPGSESEQTAAPARAASPADATGTVAGPAQKAPRGVAGTQGNPAQPLAWHVVETANFRVYHTDAVLGAKAAQAAESVRTQQARRWGSSATRMPWSPRCDIYLYPTPKDFAQMTGQPETSPGFSTMGINGNRITARRVNLRVDHPQLISAILPHEVTHVVLADLFTQQQIPRWADEGMAVLAEPLSEQLGRAADLTGPLAEGRVFKLNELMAIDYPSAEAWGLYYAQSVSVTQFLVEQGTPEQFISFVRGAQRQGIEHSLREVYHIGGFAELENRWESFARRQAATITASNRDPASENDASGRQ